MAEFITSIRTEKGNKQIDYNALANLPKSDSTLSKSNEFADAKATGDAIKKVSDDLSTEIETFDTRVGDLETFQMEVETFQTEIDIKVNEVSTGLAAVKGESDKSIKDISDEIETLQDAVDGLFEKNESGETVMQVPLQMNENKITGLGTPEADTDAVNKQYVDQKYFYGEVVLLADSWDGELAPYTQTVVLEGILETDNPHWGLIYCGEDLATKLLERECFAYVDDLETTDGQLTFTCFEYKPRVDLTIQIEVNR